jgi:hypothetical protein
MKVSLPPMLSLVFDRWCKAGTPRPYLLNGHEEMESQQSQQIVDFADT